MVKRGMFWVSASLLALLTAGCATSKDLEAVRAEAVSAREDARAAQLTANQAMETAENARTASARTDEKIDRMFKRSMYK